MSLQGYYRKAKVLQEMGHVDESLQVFLHCLALDESFRQAKHEVELVRYFFMVAWLAASRSDLRGLLCSHIVRFQQTMVPMSFSKNPAICLTESECFC